MEDTKEPGQFVPDAVLKLIRKRIEDGVADAEAKFSFNEADEDAVTGALGQAISTDKPVLFKGANGNYAYQITSAKVVGRGPNALEKRMGADAIFQVAVIKEKKTVFSKGLPFQAKMMGGFRNKCALEQAEKLLQTSGTGIVVRYSSEGYCGMEAKEVVRQEKASQASPKPKPQKLATIFGNEFLRCRIGKIDLYIRHSFEKEKDGPGIRIIDTQIVDFTGNNKR
ncbi:MAG TPA: hypothetical protein VMF08_02770 [Candidatus Sulfotelmatobacter sp.]|nr:hypothetical protein [Candidatus Sulfotelmatobacter sp.]